MTLGSDLLTLEIARGLPHNVTTEMDLTLWTVAQVIARRPGVAARFSAEDAARWLRTTAPGGCRCLRRWP